MKRFTLLVVLLIGALLFGAPASAQLAKSVNVPGDYPTFAAAIAALNANGIGAGGVTITVAGDADIVIPASGFTITVTPTLENPLIIRGEGQRFVSPSIVDREVMLDDVFKFSRGSYISVEGFNAEWKPIDVEPVSITPESIIRPATR